MPDELLPSANLDSGGTCACARCDAGDEAVRQIIAKAYASVMIIFASAFVGLVAAISLLAFFYPERASNFLVMYAVPLAGLLGYGGVKAKDAWLSALQKKKP